MTTITAARRIEQLKQERDQLRAERDRARGIAVALEQELAATREYAQHPVRWLVGTDLARMDLALDPEDT